MKIYFTDRAADDLEAIHAYLMERSPLGARRVQLAMQSTFALLADFPYLGREQKMATLRRIGVPHYPFNIYYTVDDQAQEVIVITVRHTSRAPEFFDA